MREDDETVFLESEGKWFRILFHQIAFKYSA